MKKLFTLSMLIVLVAAMAQAQGYRKWDFTNWSATTIANLQADAAASSTVGWSDIEKAADAGEGKVAPEATAGKCFWYDSAEGGTLKANGAVIAELDGLDFGTSYCDNRSLAIAVDYPSTSLGEYAGPQYLWLGGGGKNMVCFTIPRVRIGQKITMTVESHKPSDARGVELYVGAIAAENKIGDSFKPTTQATNTWEEGWELPAAATPNADGTVDVIVYNTNGCHIYLLEVGDNSQTSKVAYIYNGSLEAETAYAAINGSETFTVVPLEATAAFTQDALAQYDAVVLSNTLSNAEAIGSLKDIRPFIPMLNLNPALIEPWGIGTTTDSGQQFVDVKDTNHSLFRNLEIIEAEGAHGLVLTTGASYQAVTPAGLFADDQVLATVMGSETPAIHGHNLTHNGYLYIPAFDANPGLLANAVSVLINSKAEVGQAPKPTISLDYKNMETVVTLKSGVPGAQIFYTTDGSTPTESSNVYAEPFSVTSAGTTVKAVAMGDGYLLSEVAEKSIELKAAGPVPTIHVEQQGNQSIVTIESSDPDVAIYYNYEALSDSTQSSKYTEPIVLITPKTISAFTASATLVPSDLAQQDVTIEKPLTFTGVLAHMDANKEQYYDAPVASGQLGASDSKVAYFFSWGKSKTAYPYYDTTAEPISTTTDPETGDEVNVYPRNPEEKYDFENGWAVRSRGQIICTEVTIRPGKAVGVGSSYNPATVNEFELQDDYPVTDFYLNMSEWDTNNSPRSAIIYTTQKYQGPFAVVAYISNGNSGTGPTVVFETGQDIEGDSEDTEWQQFGDKVALTQGQRLYKKVVRVYEGTDEVYLRLRHSEAGSKAGVYDIYVLGVDPASISDGIQEIANNPASVNSQAIFSLGGMRLTGAQRGVNIVRQADGTTRKVMVK